jgi:hypothetical protein
MEGSGDGVGVVRARVHGYHQKIGPKLTLRLCEGQVKVGEKNHKKIWYAKGDIYIVRSAIET